MTWSKLSDGWNRHPKMLKLSRDARLFWVDGITFCNEQSTDGEIPISALPHIGVGLSKKNISECVSSLVSSGLWDEKTDGSGYIVHDFLVFNPSKTQVLQKRESTKKRVESFRGKQASNAVTTAMVTPPVTETGNAVGNTSPVPSRPDPVTDQIPPNPPNGGDPGADGAKPDDAVPPVSKRQPRAPKAPENMSEFELVNAVYFAEYEKARGAKPPFGSQDGKAINSLLKSVGMEKACELIRKAYADEYWKDKATIQTLARDPARFDRQVVPFPSQRRAGAQGRLPAVQDDPNWQPNRADAARLLQSAANGEDDDVF